MGHALDEWSGDFKSCETVAMKSSRAVICSRRSAVARSTRCSS
jgi:hypothetical protein